MYFIKPNGLSNLPSFIYKIYCQIYKSVVHPILSFSVSVYWGKRQSKDKTFWYSSVLNSWYLKQKHRKWISSSTRFKLLISHNRSSAGTLRYLPVSIAKGRITLLNWQKIDRLHFGINKVTYNSVLGFIINREYVRNLGLDATLSFHWWVSFSTRCSLTVCNGICEMSSRNLALEI